MRSTDRGRGSAPSKQKEPPSTGPAADPAEPHPEWLDRMQRARARHAAITRNLNTWSSYKNWADRMRETFEDEAQPDAESANGRGTGGTKPR